MLSKSVYILAAALLLTVLPSAVAADPITLTAGGPAVTLLYQSATIPGATAQASFSLSADRRTINFSFQNTSSPGSGAKLGLFSFTGLGGGVPFVTPSAFGLTLSPGVPGWVGPTDAFGQFDYFPVGFDLFRSHPELGVPPGLLSAGQGGIGFVSFSFDLPQQITLGRAFPNFVTFVVINGAGQVTFSDVNGVPLPEPGTLALLGTGLGALLVRRRAKARRA